MSVCGTFGKRGVLVQLDLILVVQRGATIIANARCWLRWRMYGTSWHGVHHGRACVAENPDNLLCNIRNGHAFAVCCMRTAIVIVTRWAIL